MTTHTPEPWAIQSHGTQEGLHGIIAPNYTKWFVAEDCKKADARRIVSCVNELAGKPEGYVRQLEQQRDELLIERNALQRICARRADCLEAIGLHADCTIDEAIAKAQGEL